MNAGGALVASDEVSSSRGVLVSSGVCALVLLGLRFTLVGELQTASFVTGWVLFVFVLGFAAHWWLPAVGGALEARIAKHQAWSLALVCAFAIHVEFRLPGGFLDLVLTSWLALMVVSLFVGRFLLTQRWVQLHVAISYGLVAACLFHGVHVHAHGLFAHCLLDQ